MMLALVASSVVLLAVRLWAASVVGFGDSEALYASWAVHPQPAYLDHPGLVGVLARAIGEGASPTPARAHLVTSFVATAVPWLVLGAARVLGAAPRRALIAALIVALVPEISVGLFALTPDLVLAPAWLTAIALAAAGLRARPGSLAGACALLGAGLLAGIAASAKVSGGLLLLALGATYAWIARSDLDERRAARTAWPWAGLASGLVVLVPIAAYEAQQGHPMLRHRLVDSQHGAGVALGNVLSLIGGQLVYLSPIVAWLAVVVAIDLVRDRRRDAGSRLLFACFAVPLPPLVLLCIWSPVAEPHWIAPALLALPLHAARSERLRLRRNLVAYGAALAATFTLLAHAWVLVPASARLVPEDADPRVDIASELYGWPTVVKAAREQMALAATPDDPEGSEVVVVGPHWTVCAQLHAAMPDTRVGCATPIPDDFDRWTPRHEWRGASEVLWVTDNRFATDGTDQLPAHVRVAESRVRILRGGRTARMFSLYLYSRRGSSDLGRPVGGQALAEAVERRGAEEHVRRAELVIAHEQHRTERQGRDTSEEPGEPAEALPEREADRRKREQRDEQERGSERRAAVVALHHPVREQRPEELEACLRRGQSRRDEPVALRRFHGGRGCNPRAITLRRCPPRPTQRAPSPTAPRRG